MFIILIALFFVLVYTVWPVREHRRLRIPVERKYRMVAPTDPGIPVPVRLFWREIGGALKAQGFVPATYYTNTNPGNRVAFYLYVAVFENREAGDSAWALVRLTDASPTLIRPFLVVEFQSGMEDGTTITTSNGTHLPIVPAMSYCKTARIPGLADLSALHRIHQVLSARHGASKKPIHVCTDYAALDEADLLREFLSRVQNGYMHIDDAKQWFRYTWKGAFLVGWAGVWPVSAIRRWMMARRARRLLRELGMPEDSPTVDYVKLIKQRQAEEPASVGPPPLERAEAVCCATCSRPIVASYYEVYGNVTCPDCQEMLYRQADSGSRIWRSLRAALAGTGAAILGVGIYCVVPAKTAFHLVMVIVLLGAIVGWSVCWGAKRRGGWFYQALAVAITYVAIAASCSESVILELVRSPSRLYPPPAAMPSPSPPVAASDDDFAEEDVPAAPVQKRPPRPTPGLVTARIAALAILVGSLLTVPIAAGLEAPIGMLPMGFALLIAWKLNKRQSPLRFSGPYAVVAEVAEPPPPT